MFVYSFYFVFSLILVSYTSVTYSLNSILTCPCAAATTEFPGWGSIKVYLVLSYMRDHSLIIMSLLGVQETRNRPGLEEITARGEKLSCDVRRTSGELGRRV